MHMPDPLSGCELKLGRAREHMVALQDLAETWLRDHPVSVDAAVADSTGEKSWWVAEEVVHPPDDWSLMFGEFLYALRSSLDHLAWQLVLQAGDQPGRSTEFPIFDDPARYRANAPRKVRGMTQPMIEAVERVQPCFRPNPPAMPLWWLQELCNIDKHRVLHVIAAMSIGGGWYGPAEQLPQPALGRLERGTELLRVPANDANMDYVPFFGIELDVDWPPHRRHLSYLVESLYAAPAGIVSSFRASFF
jgi:hypothetical protein